MWNIIGMNDLVAYDDLLRMGFAERTLILGLQRKMTTKKSAKGMIKSRFSGTARGLKISFAGNVELP